MLQEKIAKLEIAPVLEQSSQSSSSASICVPSKYKEEFLKFTQIFHRGFVRLSENESHQLLRQILIEVGRRGASFVRGVFTTNDQTRIFRFASRTSRFSDA